MKDISVKALAKINLGLDVVRKREDGYHEVRMVMQTIHLFDRLEISKNTSGEITMETNLSFLPTNENNLVYKAAKLLQDEFAIKDGVHVWLHKYIPVAAGMAGGSTDAAAVLYGMNQIFDLGLTREELMERGVKIGADVPYCIMRGTALAEGIGEKLSRKVSNRQPKHGEINFRIFPREPTTQLSRNSTNGKTEQRMLPLRHNS